MSVSGHIVLEHVDKHYGHLHVLRDVNLSIDKGQFVALVGPSGCGKSTLLRSLAGLEKISSGRLWIDGAMVNGVPPRKRDLAMVFQSYALYPHMNVRNNLTYSLRIKGTSKRECAKAAAEVAETLGLEGLLDRLPRQLSGGQRQRVAMGRAIIRHPKAFLFDEPLSNLDAALRVHMRKEIRGLHNRLKATSVYVTHDQIEAMTMADYVVVMRNGVIEQQGAPLDLYDRPVNRFVAGFIGSPAMNFLHGNVTESGSEVRLDMSENHVLSLPRRLTPGQRLVVGLRPEHVGIETSAEPALRVPVRFIEHTGANSVITTATDPELIVIHNGRIEIRAGDDVGLRVVPEDLHLFEEESEKAI